MMTAQEGVEIMIDPEKEKEAEAGAGMLDQEEADLEADLTGREIEQKDLLHKQKELTNVTN